MYYASGRSHSNAAGFDDRQLAGQNRKDGGLLNKTLNQSEDELRVGIAR